MVIPFAGMAAVCYDPVMNLSQELIMKRSGPILVAALWLAAGGCSGEQEILQRTFDFSLGTQGFFAGFADYPQQGEESMAFDSGFRLLPPEAGSGGAFAIGGTNRSDDLFMYITGPVDGLITGHSYRLSMELELASAAPSGCMGVGGAPGESVYLKIGAAGHRPLAEPAADGWYRMNIDKGNQARSGRHMVVAGDVANGIACEDVRAGEFAMIRRHAVLPVPVTAGKGGRLWLIAGSDSGFESRTLLYYRHMTVWLTPVRDGGSTPP